MSEGTRRGVRRPHDGSSDVELKARGNEYFGARKYDDAILCYTNAIKKNPATPVYYTNRALAYLRQKKYDRVVADCKAANELDPNSVKAQYFMGVALCETGQLDDGIKHLHRAVDLSREQKQNLGDELTLALRNWRKRRWSIMEEKRLAQEIELQTYLTRLVLEDKDRKIEKLKESFAAQGNDSELELNTEVASIEKFSDNCVNEVSGMFAKVDERRQKREVPDYLCGRISFDILREPVVTPSGITYERKDIEEHLLRVGHFDPVTRVKLTADQLIPNYAMKEVVDAFVTENEWALDY